MAARRVEMDRLRELVRLHRMGTGAREVARLLGMGPNTERDYREALGAAGLLEGPVDALPELDVLKTAVAQRMPETPMPQHLSTLEPWREHIEPLFRKGLGPQAIHDRLRLQHPEFPGRIGAMKRFCRRLERERGVQPQDVAIPVETDAGKVAQVDFGYVGKLYDPDAGCLRKAWVFVMVLGFSRHLVARVVFDQRVETWLQLHIEALQELGGVAETIVPDNLKAAVIRAAFGVDGEPTALNRSYRELARHYGFKVDPTPPYDSPKKGKVESGVKYVKRNFFKGREGQDIAAVRQELQRWTREIAGLREHGTTHRRPLEVFETIERSALLPLPTVRYELVVWKEATVHADSHIFFEKRLYSVPWRLIGRSVWVRATPSTIAISADDLRVATHPRRGPGLRSTCEEHLPEHRRDLRHRSREYWEERAARIGPEVAAYITEVFDSDDVLSMLRTVQAIVTHVEGYPRERARAACKRAQYFGNHTYKAVKNILKQALDLEPLPRAVAPAPSSVDRPRFARSLSDLFPQPMEKEHEPN